MGSKGGSAPKTPDYAGAAQQTAQGNLEAARAAAGANRVNQTTPYGSLTYSHTGTDPDNGWNSTVTLSPEQQQLLNQNTGLSQSRLSSAQQGLNSAQGILANPGVKGYDVTMPGDFKAGAPTTGFNPGQSYQDAMMSRLSPQIARENNQLDTQLANQGLTPGSEAYNNAKTLQAQQHNDLLNSATVSGLQAGLQANQQAYNQNAAQYQANNAAKAQGFQQTAYNQMQPINMANALQTGAQVQNPNFTNAPQQATTSGPNYLGAAQAGYNSDLNSYNASTGNQNAMMGGLFGLGSSIFGAAGSSGGFSNLFSDRRLKSNIKFLGKRGLHNWYSYEIAGIPSEGVMADEVLTIKPEAVSIHPSGYYQVNYGALA